MTQNALSSNKNSWVNAVEIISDQADIKPMHSLVSSKSKIKKAPLFHVDNLGIQERVSTRHHFHLAVDHSVTGLSELFFCPRKYYLSNVCKFDDSLMTFVKEVFDNELPDQYKKFIPQNIGSDSASTKERGTIIHRYIEDYIKGKLIPTSLESSDKDILDYCFELLNAIPSSFKLLSEYAIKFQFNGQFINGVCDLVVLDRKKGLAEVWDFKTGSIDSVNSKKYEAQMKLYAVGILSIFEDISDISLKLIYLDEKNIQSKEFNRSSIPKFSTEVLKKISKAMDKR